MVLFKLRTPSRAEFCSRALAFRGFGMAPSQDPLYAGLGQAVRIGTELLAALIVGGGLGWAIDAYLLRVGSVGACCGLGLWIGGRYQKRLPIRTTMASGGRQLE